MGKPEKMVVSGELRWTRVWNSRVAVDHARHCRGSVSGNGMCIRAVILELSVLSLHHRRENVDDKEPI